MGLNVFLFLNITMSEEVIVYISKEEFQKRLEDFNKNNEEVMKKYEALRKEKPDDDFVQKELDSLKTDIENNNKLLKRVEIEDGHLLFWLDDKGCPTMRRCSKEEYNMIYNSKNKFGYVI